MGFAYKVITLQVLFKGPLHNEFSVYRMTSEIRLLWRTGLEIVSASGPTVFLMFSLKVSALTSMLAITSSSSHPHMHNATAPT